MVKSSLIRFPTQRFRANLPTASSLEFKKSDTPGVQEINKLRLRSHAYRLLTQTYFGKGNFSWQEPYHLSQSFMKLLREFPPPFPIQLFWGERGRGKPGLLVGVERLNALKIDDKCTRIAKREAIMRYICSLYEDQVAGRPPHYRELYDPNRPQDPKFPRALSVSEMQAAMRPVIEALKTHLSPGFSNALLRRDIAKYILTPPLPFKAELPE